MRHIGGEATRLGGIFSSTFGILSAAGGIAGLFTIGHTISNINQTYQAVARVRAVTGMTAQNVHAMMDSFELAGIDSMVAERMITQMSRKSQNLEQGMAGATQQAEKLNEYYKKLGVNMKAGPSKVLEQMADAAQKGKLAVGDLITKFGVPMRQAGQMMRMLKRGSESIKGTMASTLSSHDIIDEQALSNFEDMQQTMRNLKDNWEELVGSVYKNLIPGITKVMGMVSDAINSWTPHIAKFATFFEHHMTTIVKLAKTYAMYMMANKVLGMVGVSGGVRGVIGGIAKVGGAVGGGVGKVAGGALEAIFGGRGGFFGMIVKFFSRFGISAGRLLAIGGAFAAIIGAVYLIIKNTSGATDRLKAGFAKVWESIQRVRAAFEIIFARDAPLGQFVQFLGNGLVWIFEKVLWLVEKVMNVLATTFVFLSNVLGRGLTGGAKYLAKRGFGGAWDDANAEITARRQRERAMDASDDALKIHGNLNKTIQQIIAGSKAQVIQDFRGSRFDIKQQFAEGYEPDRIATVFGDELVKAGERRLQSGFSPIFGVR